MLIRPSGKDAGKFSKNLPYTVIRKDNAAHVVNDHITGITAYVCYKAYDGGASAEAFVRLPKGKDAKPYLPVRAIDAETIVMERTAEDGSVIMSICTPDLGITQKAYTTPQPSQPLERTVVIEGNYTLGDNDGNVKVTSGAGTTTVTATCVDGRPVEFRLAAM